MVKLAYNEEKITAEDMRQALAQLVKSKIFWGKGAVKSMDISVVVSNRFFHSERHLELLLLHLGNLQRKARLRLENATLQGRHGTLFRLVIPITDRWSGERPRPAAVGHSDRRLKAV